MNLLVIRYNQDEVEPQTKETPPIFFYNYEDSAKITVINKYLLKRRAFILRDLSTGFQTNTTAFPEYALETATSYVQEHSRFYMPVSVYKILIYGSEIIATAILPIGLPSEEEQESRNKDLKHFR